MSQKWLVALTLLHRTPVVRKLGLFLTLMMLYSLGIAFLEVSSPEHTKLMLEADAAVASSVILGLLLVFRTNSAYDRWWEGRKLWGQLVNETRNLSLKCHTFLGHEPEDRETLGRLLIGFAHALKEHLRDGISLPKVPGFNHDAARPEHVPGHIAGLIFAALHQWKRQDRLDGYEALLLDQHARALMDICGACERIRKTPIPLSYGLFLRQCLGLYLFSLPWYLVHLFQFWSLPIILIGTYFMIGIELIAEDVEEPFGRGGDDLNLDELCQTIERSVHEML